MNSAEPVQVTIPASMLHEWLRHIAKGLEPSVKFSEDAAKMQDEAYKIRGDMLHYLNHSIRGWMPRYD